MTAPRTPPQQPVVAPEPRNALGLTALILGLVGLIFGLVPLTGFIATVIGIVGIALGFAAVARVRARRATNVKTSWFGLAASAGALAMGIWGIWTVFTATNQFVNDMEDLADDLKTDSSVIDEDGNTAADSDGYDAAKDVKIKTCELQEFGSITAKLKITNSGTEPRSYLIEAEAVAKGERVGELGATANNVRPGQTAKAEALGVVEGASKVTCRLVKVTSFTDFS